MSRYLEILSVSRPFHTAVDNEDRHMFSCNYEAMAAAVVADFEQEMVKLIVDAGLGTSGTDTFIGPNAKLPTSDGPITSFIDTGGISSLETHNSNLYERMTFQVVVRSRVYPVGQARALAIWRELDGTRNVTVTV